MNTSVKLIFILIVLQLISACNVLRFPRSLQSDELEESQVFGSDAHRIRNSKYRMLLKYPALAARKFKDFAFMSALAYQEHQSCNLPADKSKQQVRDSLNSELKQSGWKKVFDSQKNGCKKQHGLAFHIWINTVDKDAVIAFRGTQDYTDWWYGNLKSAVWYDVDNQYRIARIEVDSALVELKKQFPNNEFELYTTGHSLGGGLAQHIYYQRNDVKQVFAFDPSPITGFLALLNSQIVTEQHLVEKCKCDMTNPFEPRIFRIYESSEILAFLRFPVKVINPITRHVQEIRFGFTQGSRTSQHDMLGLAIELRDLANSDVDSLPADAHWFEGMDKSLTDQFKFAQYMSCIKSRYDEICPI